MGSSTKFVKFRGPNLITYVLCSLMFCCPLRWLLAVQACGVCFLVGPACGSFLALAFFVGGLSPSASCFATRGSLPFHSPLSVSFLGIYTIYHPLTPTGAQITQLPDKHSWENPRSMVPIYNMNQVRA